MKRLVIGILMLLGAFAAPAGGAERLCDPAFEDCRAPLLNLINNETVGIDVAFWFMTDTRYETALINRWRAGVPIRVIVDPKANPTYDGNAQVLADLANAGIPMRYRLPTDPGILHWKTMIFAGQNTVEFDGANYSPTAFVYNTPYTNYEWESIYFSDDPAVVNSFKTKYDDFWMDNNVYYGNYANIVEPRTRLYPTYPIDPDLNFPQQQDYAARILGKYSKETQKIDVIMYRITDARHPDAMIAAMQRGVPVRILGDTLEYRLASRLWAAYNLDRLYAAGIPVRVASVNNINHQKLVILYGQAMAVFGSSNWTTPSANQQQEHNYFTTKSWIFQWFTDQFERKWNNTAGNESVPFVPLPPDKPTILAPADGAVGIDRSLELKWDGGPWAHIYDIYFGTDPNPPLFAANQQLGPTDPATGITQKLALPLLQPGTTYYWRIVSKTMAGMTKQSAIVSFTTAGNPPPPAPPAGDATTVVIWTCTDVLQANVTGNWQFLNDQTAAGGCALWNPDHGASRISPPLAAPANEFQTTFNAVAGVPYHVWIRMRAQNNSTSNDSVSFQFDDAIDQYGSPLYQIGTPQGGEVTLNDPSGTVNGWAWADNGFSAPATLVYFPTSGPHTIQIQQREDGAIVDQIVISPDAFLSARPGGTLNDHTIYGSTLDGAAPPPDPSYYPPPPPIPSPWQQQDIGAVGMPGYANFDNAASVFTSEAAGADVWGSADAYHYIYQPMAGDGTIVARVASVQNTNVWTKAGVMIRESLAPGATNAFMFLAASKGLNFQGRTATNGATSTIAGPVKPAPYWVRVDRAGNTFTGYRSTDGVTWTSVGTYTIPMNSNALVGLALTSHNVDATAVATFDNVNVNGAATCGYTVSPTNPTFTASAGSASISVTTGPTCTWTAASGDTSWLTVAGGASGTGSGTVSLSATANTGPARSTTITVAGQTGPATQGGAACTTTLSPSSQNFAVSGGATSIGVAAGNWCSWTATSSDPSWLTVTAGSSGTGNGTVTVNVAANSAGGRTAFVTIGDQTFTASQDPATCTYAISPSSQSYGAGGGSSNVTVTTGSWCSWTAVSNDPSWLTVASGASGTGNGTVALAASANAAGARSTTATIAGKTYTASQASAPCVFTLSPASQSLAYGGDSGSFGVSVGGWCSWTASSSAAWLTVTAGNSGAGNGTVAFSAPANTGGARTATITVGGQPFTANQDAPPAPSDWSNQDIGNVGIAGATTADQSGTVLTVTGAGADIWGTADAFQFAFRTLNGDGSIVARVASVQNTNAWTKAGVMIRETLDPASAQGHMLMSAANGTAFQRRRAAGGTSVGTTGTTTVAAPYWLRLDRAGDTFTAYQSPDGVMWTIVGTDTIPMAASVYVGLALTSHNTSATATATFDSVSIVAGTRPAWTHKDIGSVGAAGTATYDAPTDTDSVKGAGADIWGTADAFQFAYRPMTGDGVVVARVTNVQNVASWTKAGVMIRETLDPGSANALMLVSYSKGLSFQRRTATGGVSTATAGALVGAPYWVKLERFGNTFNAYSSPDGTTWTMVGSDTVAMGANVYVGLAVSSHTTSTAATGTFDHVSTP